MASIGLVSIVIPTYNEAENIADLLKRTIQVLDDAVLEYEILVVDDASLDNTAEIAEKILTGKGKVIRRISNTKSLSLSILDGTKQAQGNIIVVMDADASHPPELIPRFIETLQEGYELVIGSRYIKGGGTEYFPLRRKVISWVACFIGRTVTKIKDNTSGFFCIRKAALEGIELTPYGFKIGLEVFVKANFGKFKEIPFIFVNRKGGKSKLNLKSISEYLLQVFSLFIYQKNKGLKRR
jgi:dolichol-phosphate mannosyltransferase